MNEQNALQDGSNFKSTGNLNLPVLKSKKKSKFQSSCTIYLL